MSLISVLPTTGVDQTYTYQLPEGVDDAPVGSYVTVSFGRQETVGIIWDDDVDSSLALSKIKSVKTVYDAPPLTIDMMRYIERVAGWTMTPRGLIAKMVIPSSKLLDAPKRPLKFLATGDFNIKKLRLSDDQNAAAQGLIKAVDGQKYQTILLDGVTGSGKTETYFKAVEAAIKTGQQALIMMPEIGLTGAFTKRFEDHFGVKPAVWHSGLTPKQRQTVWQGVASGVTKMVIGARSSLFLPYAQLGVIVVDEEHDQSYKQEDNVVYNARDMAVLRGALLNHPVILTSATPSLETMHNIELGRYERAVLSDRYGGAHMPDIAVIDMREQPVDKGCFISLDLNDAVAQALARGEQSLLFLNRRGYAPMTLCRACGARLECPQCTAWLVEHKFGGRTFCHHCGYGGRTPKACPACQAEDSLIPIGPGVERIAEEVKNNFPKARVALLSSDMAEEGGSLSDVLTAIQEGKIDIIIGTQMIAKGHHFPRLTCVGVVDADLGLQGGDLRASERTWQLLHQVAGRAGREVLGDDRRGQVFLQSYMPDHPVMECLASDDRDAFVAVEMEQRRLADMPPFSRLAAIILSGKTEKPLDQLGRDLAKSAPHGEDFMVLGPAVPPMAMLRGRHRRRLLVQAGRKINIQKTIEGWLSGVNVPSSIRLTVDIDPQSFL